MVLRKSFNKHKNGMRRFREGTMHLYNSSS
jgi:hypothetical protein